MSDKINFKKILITGGAGYIGNELVKSLPENLEIIVLDNFHIDTPYKRETNKELQKIRNVRLIEANVSDVESYKKTLNDVDVVIYMASLNIFKESNTNPLLYLNENNMHLQIFINALKEYSQNIKKIILTSTRGVYGEGAYKCNECRNRVFPALAETISCTQCRSTSLSPQKINESDMPFPASIYGITKKLQEDLLNLYCLDRKIPFDIFRIFNVYGEDQGKYYSSIGIVPRMFEQIKTKKEISLFGNGKIIRDFIYIGDIIKIFKQSIFNEDKRINNTEIYNVGSGEEISISDIAGIFEKIGYKFEKNYVGTYGDIKYSVADNSKASKTFAIGKFNDMLKFISEEYK